MTNTERLRALLDEHGIEWWSVESLDKVPLTVCVIDDVRYKFRPQGRGIIVSSCTEGTVTPKQAIAATCEPWNTRSDHAVQAANERKVDERDTVPVTKYQMALDDARKSNMDAERWERIARDHQSKCESLKQTNADLRRIIAEMEAATVGNGTDLSKRLREVTGLRSFAELFGFSWEDESDWDWHDVACAMADEVDAAGTEPDEATMLKLHDRMNAALLDYESAIGIEGGNGANTVPFVIEMHQIIEDAATVGAGTCEGSFHESSDLSSGRVPLYYCKGTNKSIFMEREARFCPLCGKRIEEATE